MKNLFNCIIISAALYSSFAVAESLNNGQDIFCVNEKGIQCIKKSKISSQRITLNDKKDIVNGMKKISKNAESVYGSWRVDGMEYLGSNVIYDSEEEANHLFIINLYFGLNGHPYRKCESTIAYNKREKIDYRNNEDSAFSCEQI